MGLENNSVNVEQSYSDQARGTIIGQTPNAGEEVVPGETTIVFSVSAGTEQVEVPDVEGDSEAEAEESLTDAGFEVETEEEFDDTVEEGNVIRTDPSGGSTEDRGSTVNMVVSQGEEEEEPEPETERFTVNVEASFKDEEDNEDDENEDDSASQTITVWLTDMNHDDEQYEQIVLDSDDENETIEVPVTVEEGEEATITVQRDDEEEVSRDVDAAETLQVP
ncbi:serine/threonine-protein kinase [Tetragenococcus muriaticus 3MR10-3]|uniref:Serine/threonine-protein kinase n=4 Tax=Tetragenococcus muriaticus TaxID=64642 RepID=A0A091C8R4_9ENTE|nr:serine/threonine-protein kinase [Tetragenococcus muriaticus 3MR10-3]